MSIMSSRNRHLFYRDIQKHSCHGEAYRGERACHGFCDDGQDDKGSIP